MRGLVLAGFLVGCILAAGCGHRDVKAGIVTGHGYTPANDWLLPVTNYCGENCSFMSFIPIHDPELWQVQVREQPPCVDECYERWLTVNGPADQVNHPVGSRWP